MAQKESINKDSPRKVGSIPAAIRTTSAFAELPKMPDSAARNILRRWANAASTNWNTPLRITSSPGVSCRLKLTNFESTPGTGQKIERETEPAPLACDWGIAWFRPRDRHLGT